MIAHLLLRNNLVQWPGKQHFHLEIPLQEKRYQRGFTGKVWNMTEQDCSSKKKVKLVLFY